MTDPIGDMLIRIKNAYLAKKPVVFCRATNLKFAVCGVLKNEGKILDFEKVIKNKTTELKIVLNYKDKMPAISDLRRVSKPGRRIYISSSDLKKYLWGVKLAILSTSSGIMSAKAASRNHLGGELLCEIW